jgi:flagellin
MVITNNLAAISSSDNLNTNQTRLTRSLARISSGYKLPTDDAAGMAVGTKMDAQIHRINGAKSNVANATSFVQTQDGYLSKIGKALDRMSELSILAQDATKSDNDRALYNKEFGELQSYIATNADKEFNGVSLFDNNPKSVTVDSEAGTFSMAAINLRDTAYNAVTGTISGGESTTTLSLVTGAAAALTAVKVAITQLATDRSSEGASLTRLNYSKEQLTVQRTNIDSANSVITDVDVATESTNFAKQNILVQSGTAMLAQANVQGQSVLRLLG